MALVSAVDEGASNQPGQGREQTPRSFTMDQLTIKAMKEAELSQTTEKQEDYSLFKQISGKLYLYNPQPFIR
jgi:hypothetical protein